MRLLASLHVALERKNYVHDILQSFADPLSSALIGWTLQQSPDLSRWWPVHASMGECFQPQGIAAIVYASKIMYVPPPVPLSTRGRVAAPQATDWCSPFTSKVCINDVEETSVKSIPWGIQSLSSRRGVNQPFPETSKFEPDRFQSITQLDAASLP
jgi:hypothetical protein